MKIKYLLFAVTATLALAGCSNDVDISVADVAAPVLKTVTPDQKSVERPGIKDITLTFDKNIFFYSGDASQITLNGQAVNSAEVIGSDSVLHIQVQFPSGTDSYDLEIPAGLITGPNKMPVPAVSVKWAAVSVAISDAPANAAVNAEAKALYDRLSKSYGHQIYSGMMADVAWNHTPADHVGAVTGKYPAIAGYDFIHLAHSGENWINYDDITPVKEYADAGGLITISWHWNVPNTPLAAKTVAMTSDWGASLQITSGGNAEDSRALLALSGAAAGDRLVVEFKDAKNGAQGSIKNSNWSGVKDAGGYSYDYFNIDQSDGRFGNEDNDVNSFELTLDATSAADIQKGVVISGHDYTLTRVFLVKNGKDDYSYSPEGTSFSCDSILKTGTLENQIMNQDLAQVASHLKDLQQAGIPVLWRPLHEAAGNIPNGGSAWFWWGTAGAEQFKALWQYVFNYMKNAGVNNLLWVWTGDENWADWYPGDQYVDFVGADIYNQKDASAIATKFNNMQYTYLHKMMTMSECGAIANISDIWNAGGCWSWFMPWYGDYSTGVPQASDDWWTDAMKFDHTVAR
ncbi:MAG: glycoside hydrolase family 26 protein [Prevotella sp.]|jgi:mannan endo-1,4-beta-mannosidase|nr:glycoside hydrolase family 26 protein [Prevotella sp.]MCI1246147.1 glycoside hydrolase family 26 protein [Prevotella sp.]